MILRPPRSKRTDTLCPYTTLFRSRLWHPVLIRIGANTVKTYRQASDPGVRLGEDDSYFIDLGLVFDGHEGDVGDTSVVGDAPQRQARSEEHTSELQSLMRISYAVFCLKKNNNITIYKQKQCR